MADEPIHLMFQQAAERFGDRPAVRWADRSVTYRELENRSNELAEDLLEAGATPGSPVAILATRTVDVIAAIIATLKAGCAFVPLDVSFPSATLPAILEELQPSFWLVDADQLASMDLSSLRLKARFLPLPEEWPAESATGQGRSRRESIAWDPNGHCYVYFTSGSTGRPKAIGGRLKAIGHFIQWEIENFGVAEGSRVSQLTSPAFDAFLRDAFTPLIAGGTVCAPASRDVLLDGARLAEWIDREGLNLLHCTPSLFRSLLAQDLHPGLFQALRFVLLAGEPLLPSDVSRWHETFGDRIRLVNLYGPSETTMVKFFYPVQPEDANASSIPIGKPMPGARAILVDEAGKPCPAGKVGEIYIRTPYRSLGYLNRPDLTNEVFVPNPFSDRPEDIVYKTGDLGRMRQDGNFEFIGRRDQQVKVRGVRVEIAPIEDRLRLHEAVAEAAVVDQTDTLGNRFLCAYIVLRREIPTSDLAGFLRESLPEPMVPSVFMTLESLPRTLSGKVDRRNLPKPNRVQTREYAPPRSPVEEVLCDIYSEVLGNPRIGAHDHFFELGGHSLLATLLLSRIRSAFEVELTLRQILQTPTVEGLALAVTRLQLEQGDVDEMASLLDEIEGLSQEELDAAV
jgi:amino acid adenylation domain-containing protein